MAIYNHQFYSDLAQETGQIMNMYEIIIRPKRLILYFVDLVNQPHVLISFS